MMVYILAMTMPLILRLATASCPTQSYAENEWQFEIGSKCYQYTEDRAEQVSFDVASSDCKNRGGNLVTIKDNTTQIKLVTKLREVSSSHTVLLGLRNYANGGWKWVTGEGLTYSNWETQMKCTYDCNCAKLKLEMGGKWEKTSCTVPDWYTVYICEYEAGNGSLPLQALPGFVILMMSLTVVISTWLP